MIAPASPSRVLPSTPAARPEPAAVERLVAQAASSLADETPGLYLAVIGEHAYSLVPASRLHELHPSTPLVARLSSVVQVSRIEATAGERIACLDAVVQSIIGPRPQSERRGRGGHLQQPRTAVEAHSNAEQFGGC